MPISEEERKAQQTAIDNLDRSEIDQLAVEMRKADNNGNKNGILERGELEEALRNAFGVTPTFKALVASSVKFDGPKDGKEDDIADIKIFEFIRDAALKEGLFRGPKTLDGRNVWEAAKTAAGASR